MNHPLSRRGLLQGLAALGAGATLPLSAAEPAEKAKLRGNIKHSVCAWCFRNQGEKWSLDKTCEVTARLGGVSVELLRPEDFKTVAKHGLTCAIASTGISFMKGFNNPAYHDEVIARTKETIDACAEAKVPRVIGFTGFKRAKAEDPKSREMGRDEMEANCVKGLKQVVGHAEKKGVTVCVEHLNTRDSSHPMKGHPGYSGDDLDWVAGIIRKVGSERLRLLFDIYHVQVMHGDVIRRLDQCKDVLGHIHTAGNPGRGELDDTQEINYRAVMRKLVDLKYTGHVGHEFIPTRDPLQGLTEAISVCDV